MDKMLQTLIDKYSKIEDNGKIISKLQSQEIFDHYLSKDWFEFLISIIDKANSYKDKNVIKASLNNAASFDDDNSRNNKGESQIYFKCFLHVDISLLDNSMKISLLNRAISRHISFEDLDQAIDNCLKKITNAQDIINLFNVVICNELNSKECGSLFLKKITSEDWLNVMGEYIITSSGNKWKKQVDKYVSKYKISF